MAKRITPSIEPAISVTRYQQPHFTEPIPMLGGGYTQGGRLYLAAIFEPG